MGQRFGKFVSVKKWLFEDEDDLISSVVKLQNMALWKRSTDSVRSFALLVVSASWGFLHVAEDTLVPDGSSLWFMNTGVWCES